jgi:hypothetical protein
MIIFLILFCGFFFGLALHSPTSALAQSNISEKAERRVRLERAKAACYGRDWKKEVCHFKSSKKALWDYQRNLGDDLLELPVDAATGFSEAMQFVSTINNYFTLPQQCALGIPLDLERIEFKGFLREMEMKAREMNLTNCGKSCFAKCLVSHLVKYELNFQTRHVPQTDLEIFCSGKGKCTNYARLGSTLQDAVGIPSKARADYDQKAKSGHAFLEVSFDGKSFYAEPQNDRCEFFYIE